MQMKLVLLHYIKTHPCVHVHEVGITTVIRIYIKTHPCVHVHELHLHPRSLTVVNILGSQKCALFLCVPYVWFTNWPDDESASRNMSPHT